MRDLHRFSNLHSEDKLDRLERLNSITSRAYSVRFSLDSHQKQRAYGEEDLVTMLVLKLRNIYERSKYSMKKFTFLKLAQKSPNLKFLTDILIENEKKTWLRKLMECSVRVSRYHTLQKQRLSREKRRQLAYMLIGNLKSKLTIAFYQLRNNLLECLQPEEKRQLMHTQRQRIDKNESKLKNTKLAIKMLESLYNCMRTKYIELALDLIKKTDAPLPAYPVKLYTQQPAYRPRERITGNHRDLSSSYPNTGLRGSESGSITNRSEQSDSRVIRNKALMDRIQQVKIKGIDTVRTINEQVKLRELTKTSASQTQIAREYVMKYAAVQVHCAMRICFNKLTENCAEAQRDIERQDSRKFIVVNEMFSKLMRAQDSKKEKVIAKIMHSRGIDVNEKTAKQETIKKELSVNKENKYSSTDVEKNTDIESIRNRELELAQSEIKKLNFELQASQGREAASQQSARQEVELVRAKYQTECEKRTNEAQEALANLDQAETALRRNNPLCDTLQSDILFVSGPITTFKTSYVDLQYSQLPSLVLQPHSSSTLSITTLNITLLTAYIYSPTPTCPSSSFSPNTTLPTSPSHYLRTLLTRILVNSTTHHAQSLHTAFSRLRIQRLSADLQTATDINVYHCRRLVKLNQTLTDMRKIDDRIAVMPSIAIEGQMVSTRVCGVCIRADTVDKQCDAVSEIDENDRNDGQINQNNHGNVERIENNDKIAANYQNDDHIELIDRLQIMEWYSCPPGIDLDDDSQSEVDIDMRKDAPAVLERQMTVIGENIISVELPIAKRLKYFSKLTRATRILERSLTRFSFNLIKS